MSRCPMKPTTTRLAALAKTARGYIAAGYASLPHLKATTHAPYISMETLADPVWAPRDYAAFAREGMMQNAVLYRCVRMIAECAASVPLLLYDGDTEVTDHPFLTLLNAPGPGQTRTDLLEAYYGFLLVAGNSYLEAVPAGGRIRELHTLRPDRMRIVPGLDGWPDGYEYSVNGQISRLIGEAVPGVSRVWQTKLFHPANDHYGLSPIEAAATAVDIHNEASKWNKALLDNSARPSGALVYGNGQTMTAAQFDRLKSELEETYAGARNAGRPMLLEGGLDWKAMSLSPRDMDFIALKQMAAREIALALGVPPMLLGIPGDNTYANYTEANRVFWRQTVIPLVARTASAQPTVAAWC
jgi:HK97 family phage portal protein